MQALPEIRKFKNVDDYIEQQWAPLPLWNHELALYHPYPYHYPNLVKHMPLDYLDALPTLKANFLSVKIYPAADLNECILFEVPLRYYTYTGTAFDTTEIEKLYPDKERRYFKNLQYTIRMMQAQNKLENYRQIIHATPTPFDAKVMKNFADYGHEYYCHGNDDWMFFWLPQGDIAIYF